MNPPVGNIPGCDPLIIKRHESPIMNTRESFVTPSGDPIIPCRQFSGNIQGAPRLTLIMYVGTLMVTVLVWILIAVARILGVESNGLKTHS